MARLFELTITDDIELIWELDQSSLETFYNKITNKFWKGVFISWSRYQRSLGNFEIEHFPIWNSEFLNVKGIIQYKNAFQKSGLNYVKDILNKDGHVLGYEEFKNKFNINVNFVDFYSLMHCIRPELRKREIKSMKTESNIKLGVEKIRNTIKVCKMVYSNITKESECTSTS
jgi:hypothetical protein